jgi:hypothetical protein
LCEFRPLMRLRLTTAASEQIGLTPVAIGFVGSLPAHAWNTQPPVVAYIFALDRSKNRHKLQNTYCAPICIVRLPVRDVMNTKSGSVG